MTTLIVDTTEVGSLSMLIFFHQNNLLFMLHILHFVINSS